MLKYTVSMPNPGTHYFEVKLEADGFDELGVSASKELHVKMPVWTPGSYLVREFSRNIPELKARLSDSGKEAKCQKVSKNEWIIETEGSSKAQISYRVYAFELTVDTSYLDTNHGIINGASVFAYIQGMEERAGTLEIIPFSGWKRVSTGLKRETQDRFEFSFPNYDVLVDSPLEIGNQSVHEFDENGTRYEVSIFSSIPFDQDRFVSDVQNIVKTTEKVFLDVPYDRYVFIVDFASENLFGGLEHLNSTHCIAQILRLDPPEEYHQLLSLFSHEFFHAWNVKRMRPRGLGPFQYDNEVYTKSLWIAEGITSYYDDLLLRRSGIFDVGEYLDAFSSNISLMKTLPGSRMQSAEEASFDAWIKYYRQNENSPNVTFSYYTQGAVIGWMLDMEIRKSSGLAKNLDDVMRRIYRETFLAQGRGYTDEEFERVCVEVSGSHSTRGIFEDRVTGRRNVDYDRYLGYAGLKLVPKKKDQQNLSFLGVRMKEDSGRTLITTVLSLSPAETSGLSANDEILAANGIRMDKSRLAYYISNRPAGDLVTLTASRQGSLYSTEALLISRPILEYRISKKETAGEDEKKLYKNWLGADWSEEIEYKDYTTFPGKANLLDYV